MSNIRKETNGGFTIVELLIVIVIIAILAAITMVSYNGITKRANNTAIISAASSTMKAVQAYIASEGTYPSTDNKSICVTRDTGCAFGETTLIDPDDTFDANVRRVSTLPKSVPKSGTAAYGVTYNYAASRTHNGQSRPAMLVYYLNGTNKSCGLSGVMTKWGITGQESVTAPTGYTAGNSPSGKTMCFISVDGPAA